MSYKLSNNEDLLGISKLLRKPTKSKNKFKVENNNDNKFLISGFLIILSVWLLFLWYW